MPYQKQYTNRSQDNIGKQSRQGKSSKKTLEELANEIKSEYFNNGLYEQLLNLTNIGKLKEIFAALEKFAKEMSQNQGLTSSQLRNVYTKVLQAKQPIDLHLIRPNLAYVAARNEKSEAKKVMAFIDSLIQKVNSEEEQNSFNKVMEALVAYHKYATSK
jgi:CRISPR-associated protein Csm2